MHIKGTKPFIAAVGVAALLLISACSVKERPAEGAAAEPVDYVNPYMGNISHLLVPTYPTVHLPNSILRVYPERDDYTGDRLNGLPLIVTSHRGRSAFSLSPCQGSKATRQPVIRYHYDQEKITPYRYQVYLDFHFERDTTSSLIFHSRKGELAWDGKALSGYQYVDAKTKVYLYAEPEHKPEATVGMGGSDATVILAYEKQKDVAVRYGISFISTEQARKNLQREITTFDVNAVAEAGRAVWNDALGKIKVSGGTEDDKQVFYTSLYRCYERPVCLSEDGQYYSAFDGQVHDDDGHPFYTDDWLWDTYRATHPLRILIDPERESDILHSFLLMAEQMGTNWLPTFPEVTGDSRRMNSNHGVATLIDAWRKGVRGFDLEKGYQAAKAGIEEKTLAPWSGKPAGWLDAFYKEHGYIPALRPGEKETDPNVSAWEKRQPVAVTLGTAYDQWCLSQIAAELGKQEEATHYLRCSYNYRNLFHPTTRFFHPKDKDGNFIKDVDYR